MLRYLIILLCFSCTRSFSQGRFPHPNAHAHNDYEHKRPLKDALQNGFISVEADVHLHEGMLLVSHGRPGRKSRTLEKLYLDPLDSMVRASDGYVYAGYERPFYLMIDCKTEAKTTYEAVRKVVAKYPTLRCSTGKCPVKIFLSGNRPVLSMEKEGYSGIGIDGRPNDLEGEYSIEMMPVISDHFKNWSKWNGKGNPSTKDIQRVKDLAQRVHAKGKKLRLWAIPDNERAWGVLLEAGVDFINSDRLVELNEFLTKKEL